MKPRSRAPIVVATLFFVLAAVAEIATGRSGVVVDEDALTRARRAALGSVDEALGRHDIPAALRAWQEAYAVARRSRSAGGLLEAAEAQVRIGRAAGAAAATAPRAREIFMAALTRARAERSVEGAVRAAEGFAALGDAPVTELALRVAASLAARSPDPGAPVLVEHARARLLGRPSGVAQAIL